MGAKRTSSTLLLAVLFGCTWEEVQPDQFYTSYGFGSQDDGTVKSWTLDPGDFDIWTFGLSWDIGPRRVQIVEPAAPHYEHPPLPKAGVAQQVEELPEPTIRDDVREAVDRFTAMDMVSRILVVVLAMWILFIYRKPLQRLIFRENKDDSQP